jgi:hypothetical protein
MLRNSVPLWCRTTLACPADMQRLDREARASAHHSTTRTNLYPFRVVAGLYTRHARLSKESSLDQFDTLRPGRRPPHHRKTSPVFRLKAESRYIGRETNLPIPCMPRAFQVQRRAWETVPIRRFIIFMRLHPRRKASKVAKESGEMGGHGEAPTACVLLNLVTEPGF